MTDLLPCPFCQCEVFPRRFNQVQHPANRCALMVLCFDLEEWNTRASTPSLAAAVEALRDAFVAGFNNSFEGFNREYPFGEDRATDEQVWEKIKDGFQDFLDARVCKEKK